MIWRVSCECLLVLALRYLSRVKVQSWPFPQSRCYRWPAKVLASSRPLTNQIGMQYWITHTDQLWHWHTGTNCKGEKKTPKEMEWMEVKCGKWSVWNSSNEENRTESWRQKPRLYDVSPDVIMTPLGMERNSRGIVTVHCGLRFCKFHQLCSLHNSTWCRT